MPPDMRTSNRFGKGEFSHSPLRKGNGNVEVVIGVSHPPGIAGPQGEGGDGGTECSQETCAGHVGPEFISQPP